MADIEAARRLATLDQLSHRVRQARQGFWFPLVLFGLLIFAALPLYLVPVATGTGERATSTSLGGLLGGYFLPGAGSDVALYWLVALPLGYLATLAFYGWRARRLGVASRVWPGLAIGIGLFLLLIVTTGNWLAIPVRLPGDLVVRGLAVLLPVALGLFPLAYYERSIGLLAFAVGFLGVVLLVNLYDLQNVLFRLGWLAPGGTEEFPNVILPGLILLLGGAGFGAWHRQKQ